MLLCCRYKRMSSAVAGVTNVNSVGIENVDLSGIIKQHLDYPLKIKEILEFIDLTKS